MITYAKDLQIDMQEEMDYNFISHCRQFIEE